MKPDTFKLRISGEIYRKIDGTDRLGLLANFKPGFLMNPSQKIPWGVQAQTGVLIDVLLGKPDHFRWVPLNSISAATFANQ